MTAFRTFLLTMQVASAFVLVGLSIPLILRKVPPNRAYGFRVPRTLADPAVWYEANAYSGKCVLLAGVAIFVGCVVLFEIPGLDDPSYAICCAAVALGSIGVAVFRSVRFLGRIAKSPDPR
jgi:SdpI/YfhL protein family